MKTNTESFDVRALKWGGLAMVVYLVGSFVTLPRMATADPGGDGPRRHGPPPAAFEACKGKKIAEACEVAFGERKMTGKCAALRDSSVACRPDRPMGPPPELLKACEGKKDGDACSAQLGERALTGQCHTGRGDALMCRPSKRK